jgi:hypothetical protein
LGAIVASAGYSNSAGSSNQQPQMVTKVTERLVWTTECEKIQNQTERRQCEGIMAGYSKSLQSATTVAPATTQPKSTTTAKPQSRVLYQKTGSANHSGQPFQAPDGWKLLWSYDCSNFKQYGGGNFIVSDDSGAGVNVNELGTGGKGAEYIDQGGRIKLQVISTCDRWTLKAVAP